MVEPVDSYYALYKSNANPSLQDVAYRSPTLNVNGVASVDVSIDWVVNGDDTGNLCKKLLYIGVKPKRKSYLYIECVQEWI